MTRLPPPIVDERTLPGVRGLDEGQTALGRLLELVRERLELPEGTQVGPGDALTAIGWRLAEVAITRVNGVPDRNLLAFLELIGVRRLAPQVARAPLCFTLAARATGRATVPAGTPVAGAPLAGDAAPVVFETERPLVLTPRRLSALVVHEPGADRWSDRGAAHPSQPFPPFAGETPIAHDLFVAHEMLAVAGPKSVAVYANLSIPGTQGLMNADLELAVWDGVDWRSLGEPATPTPLGLGLFSIGAAEAPAAVPIEIGGHRAPWLRVRLKTPLPPSTDPEAEHARIERRELPPDALSVGESEIPVDLPFDAFGSEADLAALHLAFDEPSARAGAEIMLTLTLDRPGAAGADGVELAWEYCAADDGTTWYELGRSSSASAGSEEFALSDGTRALTQDGQVSFRVPVGWRAVALVERGAPRRWLRVGVVRGGYDGRRGQPRVARARAAYKWALPALESLRVGVERSGEGQPPDAVVAREALASVAKPFPPFGERPAFNDVFQVGSAEALSKGGAVVRLDVQLVNPPADAGSPLPPVYTQGNLEIVWEALTDGGWVELFTSRAASRTVDHPGAPDQTFALTRSGVVSLQLPADMAPATVAGSESYWLRARIARGHYGQPERYELRDDGRYQLVAATLSPPWIRSISIAYEWSPRQPPEAVRTSNDFGVIEPAASDYITPFAPPADVRPALYAGFDGAFANDTVTLFAEMPVAPYDPGGGAHSPAEVAADPARVAWAYLSESGWRRLAVRDETDGLRRPGTIEFVGPPDLVRETLFEREAYWLRARLEGGLFERPPLLAALRTNTTWAGHATTPSVEVLGSSTAEAEQRFRAAHAPVLPGQRVEVREERPSQAAEAEALAPRPGEAGAGAEAGSWVLWHEVRDLAASGPLDRHYVLDRVGGTVRLGDGRFGMVPPRGRSNVRMSYRAGGGAAGNRPAGNLVKLKTAIAYVESVTNPVESTGGAEAEGLDSLRRRGPRTLRHRDRAIAPADFEDLAFEATPGVARAYAIAATGAHDAGRVTLVLVARSAERRPVPTLALIETVRAHLQARLAPTVELVVRGPEWLAVGVSVTIVPVALERAHEVAAAVEDALEAFLHPLSGGPGGRGWDLGRRPRRSDLYALVEAVDGVDHARGLAIDAALDQRAPFLVCSGQHAVTIAGGDVA